MVQKVTSLNKKNMSSALRLLCNHLIAERRQSYRPKMLGYRIEELVIEDFLSKTNNPCMFLIILFKIIYEIIYFFNLTIL